MPDIVTNDGGRGAGVEAWGRDYPFITPPADAVGLLADLWLCYSRRDHTPPFRVAALFNLGRALGTEPLDENGQKRADILVVDADDAVVFDSRETTDYKGATFGTRFYQHAWTTETVVCRAVQHLQLRPGTAIVPNLRETEDELIRSVEVGEERETEQSLSPVPALVELTDAWLDERTYELWPRRVTSITVGDITVRGDVVFQEGFNCTINAGERARLSLSGTAFQGLGTTRATLYRETPLAFSVVPGGGAGPSNRCTTDNDGLRSISSIAPDASGNFTLAARDCIYVAPVPSANNTPVAGKLQLGNQCGVCCPCSEYVDLYRKLTALYQQLKQTGALAETVRDAYVENRARWLAAKDCTRQHPLRVAALGVVVDTGDSETESVVTYGAIICNTSDVCWTNVELALTMEFEGAPGDPLIGSGIKYEPNGDLVPFPNFSWDTTTVTWASIAPGRHGTVQFTFIFKAGNPAAAVRGTTVICGTATCAEGTIPLHDTQQETCFSADV